MYDVKDLLPPSTLRGQDRTWREDLDVQEQRNAIGHFDLNCSITSVVEVGVCSYHRAYRLYCRGDWCG